jgi:amino-acid N-acetyltransferase
MKKAKNPAPPKVSVRKARMGDVEAMHALIAAFARRDFMLPRSRAELYDSLRDYQVAVAAGRVVGCGALVIAWENLGEIRSLAVAEAFQRKGIGGRLAEACLDEARRLGIKRVFALTNNSAFFKRLGFVPVAKETLPHKIWADCIKCPKFPDCDEEAVAINLA